MKYETRLEMLKLSDIVAAPYNPREDIERGSDEYKALRRSIELNGMVEPPVVNLHNMRCIGGNQRLVVLRDLGWKEVLCSVIDQPDESKEMKLCLALNRIEGRWDTDRLGDLLRDDEVLEFETGFDRDEVLVYRQLGGDGEGEDADDDPDWDQDEDPDGENADGEEEDEPAGSAMSLPWELRLSELDTYTSRWRSHATSVWSKASGTPVSSTREKSPRR